MASVDIPVMPDRDAVDARLLLLDGKVNTCLVSIARTELALRHVDYDMEEERLERNLARLRHEPESYRGLTNGEREEKMEHRTQLCRERDALGEELSRLIAAKRSDEVRVLGHAADMVAQMLAHTDAVQTATEVSGEGEGEGEEGAAVTDSPRCPARVAERLSLRRELLREVQAAIAAGMDGHLQLHPIRPSSRNLYFVIEDEGTAGKVVMVRHANPNERHPTEPQLDLMLVAVMPACFNDAGHPLIPECDARCVMVVQPFVSATGVAGGGVVYRGILNQRCEPHTGEATGEATYMNGSTYTGPWCEGQRHGSGARLVTVTGDCYTGPFEFDAMTGDGTMTYANGDVYVGHFLDGKRDGFGIHTCSAAMGGSRYEGDWAEDYREGHGTCDYPEEGLRYAGEWRRDQRCGHGTLTTMDARGYYEGAWSADCRHGSGAVHFAPSGVRYDGKWRKGVRCGQASAFTVESPEAAAQYAAGEAGMGGH